MVRDNRPHVTVLNVDKVSVDELTAFIYPMPEITETDSVDIIAPLLIAYANDYNLFSQLHAKMMAVKSRQKSTDNSVKCDILYRALRAAEMGYNATSRILSAIHTKNPSYRWGTPQE